MYIIEGIQGQVWTETIRTSQQLHEMMFPRMLALAERAWHKSEWEQIPDRGGSWKQIRSGLRFQKL